MGIPKQIFQTWETKDVSNDIQQLINSWKEYNPEYRHIFHDKNDRENFIRDNFNSVVSRAYNRIIPGAYKADLWRYCVLYIHGGVYVDIDTICLGKLDTFLNDSIDFMVPIDLNTNESQGYYNLACGFIASAPKSPILLECINKIVDNVLNNIIPPSRLDLTGPGVLGRSTNKYLNLPETTSFVGKEGHLNNIHFLKFERYTEYVMDSACNRLFQNKCGNAHITHIYNNECRKNGVVNWVTTNDIIAPV